jgi:NTP pyrophosphatase (non-canonical NTP hydrolase)
MNNLKIPEITIEECAEVIQAITKALRFGLHQKHPETGVTNKEHLECELGQLMYMMEEIGQLWDLDFNNISDAYLAKEDALKKWSKFNV